MDLYHQSGGCSIYHGDSRPLFFNDGAFRQRAAVWVLDPPFAEPCALWARVWNTPCRIVFTDPRNLGAAVQTHGGPWWSFTWDTGSPWTTGRAAPLQQSKLALVYLESPADFDRDRALWGEPPPARNHPSTKQVPLDGRRLTDVYRESLRYLHNPERGTITHDQTGKRMRDRKGSELMRHAKPVDWVRCLIGCASPDGLVLDPFMGTGTTLLASRALGRPAVGVDVDERMCELAATRLESVAAPKHADQPGQLGLDL